MGCVESAINPNISEFFAPEAEGLFWGDCLAIWCCLLEPFQSILCLHWGLPLPLR